jgi:hypothetical protein
MKLFINLKFSIKNLSYSVPVKCSMNSQYKDRSYFLRIRNLFRGIYK